MVRWYKFTDAYEAEQIVDLEHVITLTSLPGRQIGSGNGYPEHSGSVHFDSGHQILLKRDAIEPLRRALIADAGVEENSNAG